MKKWWQSKTIWVALFAFVSTIVLESTGFEIPAMYQTAFLSVVMVILRMVTGKPVAW